MNSTYQQPNKAMERLTSATTLELLHTKLLALNNGYYWYEVTSGASGPYTNGQVRANCAMIVYKREENILCLLYPYSNLGIWMATCFYEVWTDFVRIGNGIYATEADLQTGLTNLATDISSLQTQVGTNTTNISTLQNQVNNHLGYATYFVSGVQTDIDLIFDSSFTSTTAKSVRITYCNGMITMIGYLEVNTQISPILGTLNTITRLTNDFLPGTGGIIEYFAGYNTEIGIGHMEGTELRCKVETAIPPNTEIHLHATFPCSKDFAYIDNLLADYKISY